MINLNYSAIGDRIKSKRKSLNLTQLQLAEKVGLTESSISRYESGKISTMPTSTVNKICYVLGLEPSVLLGITPENSFEYDLKDILSQAEELPLEAKNELLTLFKEHISIYRRLYLNEKTISKKIKK